MKINLKHLAGSTSGRTDSFDPASTPEILFGRGDDCAVKYDADRDDLVSRHHLKIVASSSCPSGVSIVDLQSRNGTFVNKQRITSSTCLQHFDLVQMGPGGPEFRVEYDPPPATVSRPTRVVDTGMASTARLTREASLPPMIAATAPRPVGRQTVERMLGESFQKVKIQSNKALWIGAGSIAAVLMVGVGLYLYMERSANSSSLQAQQQQVLLQHMDQQVKAQPVAEEQMKAEIAQLGEQLKAAQAENKKAFSQLARPDAAPIVRQQPVGATEAADPAPNPAYDQQIQVAVQQFSSNDIPGSMKTCAALIKMDPKRWEAYALAGRALSAANKPAQAKGFFAKAEQLAPDDTKPKIQQMSAQVDAQVASTKQP